MSFTTENHKIVISNSEERRREISRTKRKISFLTGYFLFVFLLFISFLGFSQPAKRVVSLAPSITDMLYQIGAEDILVGCTSYCNPAIADGVPQVGSTVEVNVEKVLSLRPELVLTMLMTKTQDIEAMRKLGIRVEIIPSPVSFDEICEQAIEIGKMVGKQENARRVIAESKRQVDSLIMLVDKGAGSKKFFFQIGANPVFTVLENTFMNDFITFSRGTNIAAGMNKGTITRESVLVKNPDVILIATMGGFGEEELKVWNSYNGLNAVKNKKVFLIDSETSCSPTPVNFVKAFTDIVNYISE